VWLAGLAVIAGIAMSACRPVTQFANPAAAAPAAAAPIAGKPTAAPVQAKGLPEYGKTVQTDDIVTYYEEHGEGEPVILLHGALQNTDAFSLLIPDLKGEFKLYALDSRGRGRTTDSVKPLGYRLMMSDTVAFMDALGIDQAHIVGISDGAIIGLHLAVYHPERVKSVVSFGGVYDVNGAPAATLDWIANVVTIADMRDWADSVRAMSPQPERVELVFEKVRSMLVTQPHLTQAQLESIPVPVLILDGEHDEFVTPQHNQEMGAWIPGAELVLIKGTGHYAPYEKTSEFNQIVLEYLRRHAGQGG
jgi:pimeloyl-ACP methyl ester carboxylesterase